MVSVIGGAIGLALSFAGAWLFLDSFPAALVNNIAGTETPAHVIAGRMIVFTAVVRLLATIIFSLTPILQAHLFDRAGGRGPKGKMPGWGALRLLHCIAGVPMGRHSAAHQG